MGQTDVEVDIEALVGEAAAMPCESINHGGELGWNHDDGPATHYMMMMHECWLPEGQIYAGCAKSADSIRNGGSGTPMVRCLDCGQRVPRAGWVIVVGPVGT